MHGALSYRYTGGAWATLASGGSSWEVRVKGNLSIREDTGRVNSSPTTVTFPGTNLIHGCNHTLVIPGNRTGCGGNKLIRALILQYDYIIWQGVMCAVLLLVSCRITAVAQSGLFSYWEYCYTIHSFSFTTCAVQDIDGDIVRCRWAVGDECADVCESFNATLSQEKVYYLEQYWFTNNSYCTETISRGYYVEKTHTECSCC